MSKIKKTLGILVATAIIGLASGCETNNSKLDKTYQEYAEIAEKKSVVHSASLNYNRAQYLQLQEIIENNNKLLKQKGVSVDISEYIKTAEEYAKSAEDFTTIHASNYRYNKAQYYMNEAVLKQQEALK